MTSEGDMEFPGGSHDAEGPAWRAAVSMGMDMTLIECNMDLTPWERVLQNDRALRFVSEIRRGSPFIDGDPV